MSFSPQSRWLVGWRVQPCWPSRSSRRPRSIAFAAALASPPAISKRACRRTYPGMSRRGALYNRCSCRVRRQSHLERRTIEIREQEALSPDSFDGLRAGGVPSLADRARLAGCHVCHCITAVCSLGLVYSPRVAGGLRLSTNTGASKRSNVCPRCLEEIKRR